MPSVDRAEAHSLAMVCLGLPRHSISGAQQREECMVGRLTGKVAVVTGAAPRGEGVGNGMATA